MTTLDLSARTPEHSPDSGLPLSKWTPQPLIILCSPNIDAFGTEHDLYQLVHRHYDNLFAIDLLGPVREALGALTDPVVPFPNLDDAWHERLHEMIFRVARLTRGIYASDGALAELAIKQAKALRTAITEASLLFHNVMDPHDLGPLFTFAPTNSKPIVIFTSEWTAEFASPPFGILCDPNISALEQLLGSL